MSITLKAAAAAVVLALTGTANAAFTGSISKDEGKTGDGELFINIFRNSANPATIVLDTNISANDLINGTVTSFTSNAVQTQAVADFFATAPISDFLFDAGAVQDSTEIDKFGMLLTNTVTTTTPPDAQNNLGAFFGYVSNMQLWVDQVNQGEGAGPDGMLQPVAAAAGTSAPPGDWSNGFQGWNGDADTLQWIPTTDTAVSNDLTLYRYHYDPDTFESLSTVMGLLSIDTATGVVSYSASPVPVPAAVWLFGSGLIGMVGVARRRRAA